MFCCTEPSGLPPAAVVFCNKKPPKSPHIDFLEGHNDRNDSALSGYPTIPSYKPSPRGPTVPTTGRSSGLGLNILLCLPGNLSPSGLSNKTPPLQRRDRAGLAPASLFTGSKPKMLSSDTCNVSIFCYKSKCNTIFLEKQLKLLLKFDLFLRSLWYIFIKR